VLCCRHVDQVVGYLENSSWSAESEFMKVRSVIGKDCSSVGDAMRFIDQLHEIKSDFLVLSGSHVSNFTLKEALEVHKNRRQKDSNAIATIVMTEGHNMKSRLRLGKPWSRAAVEKDTYRLLKYEEVALYKNPSCLESDSSFPAEGEQIKVIIQS